MVNCHVDKQYNRYLISSEDFIEAKGYLEALESNPADGVVCRALLMAAIVSYCRPFTNNSGNRDGAIPSISQKFINELASDEKSLHEKLTELRHKVLAHSDFDAKACQRAPDGMALMKVVDILNENININLFLKIADSMAAKCMRKNIALDREHPL